jgi:hypothetical protein
VKIKNPNQSKKYVKDINGLIEPHKNIVSDTLTEENKNELKSFFKLKSWIEDKPYSKNEDKTTYSKNYDNNYSDYSDDNYSTIYHNPKTYEITDEAQLKIEKNDLKQKEKELKAKELQLQKEQEKLEVERKNIEDDKIAIEKSKSEIAILKKDLEEQRAILKKQEEDRIMNSPEVKKNMELFG